MLSMSTCNKDAIWASCGSVLIVWFRLVVCGGLGIVNWVVCVRAMPENICRK